MIWDYPLWSSFTGWRKDLPTMSLKTNCIFLWDPSKFWVCIWGNRARMKAEELLLLFLLHPCLYETLPVVSWLTALLLLCSAISSSPPGQSPQLCTHMCKTMTTQSLAQLSFYSYFFSYMIDFKDVSMVLRARWKRWQAFPPPSSFFTHNLCLFTQVHSTASIELMFSIGT